MSKQAFYTALTRGITLDHVNFQYTDRIFKESKPRKSSIEAKSKAKVVNCVIYCKTDNKDYYIGSTTGPIEVRNQQHIDNPVSAEMAEFMKGDNIETTVLREIKCMSKRFLLEAEDEMIESYKAQGKSVLNKRCNVKKEEVKEIKPIIVHEAATFLECHRIKQNMDKKMFVIQYRDGNGEKRKKETYFKRKSQNEAKKEIEEWCNKNIGIMPDGFQYF
jgi:hypothetical protein